MFRVLNTIRLFIFGVSLLSYTNSFACTTFIRNDPKQGTLFSKVRDISHPNASLLHNQQLVFFNQGNLRFIALLYAQPNSAGHSEYISVGSNEAGLTISVNFASSQKDRITQEYGSIAKPQSDIIRSILLNDSTVEQALSRIESLQQSGKLVPAHLSIADKQSAVIVEIADTGEHKTTYAIKRLDSKPFVMIANHFDLPKLEQYNDKITESSAHRYARAKSLLTEISTASSFNINQSYSIAKDYNEGEKNSIFSERSRATYITSSNENNLLLFIELTNPPQSYQRVRWLLDKTFWQSHQNGDVLLPTN